MSYHGQHESEVDALDYDLFALQAEEQRSSRPRTLKKVHPGVFALLGTLLVVFAAFMWFVVSTSQPSVPGAAPTGDSWDPPPDRPHGLICINGQPYEHCSWQKPFLPDPIPPKKDVTVGPLFPEDPVIGPIMRSPMSETDARHATVSHSTYVVPVGSVVPMVVPDMCAIREGGELKELGFYDEQHDAKIDFFVVSYAVPYKQLLEGDCPTGVVFTVDPSVFGQ